MPKILLWVFLVLTLKSAAQHRITINISDSFAVEKKVGADVSVFASTGVLVQHKLVDSTGRSVIILLPGVYKVSVNATGYKTFNNLFNVSSDTVWNFFLSADVKKLADVTVYTGRWQRSTKQLETHA